MAGSNIDRSDTHRMLREQASRVYLQTIAANEREDRILHKKLDALDLEHRAQFLKMKRWIQDAHVTRKKRLKKMESNSSYFSEKSSTQNVEKEKHEKVKLGRKERKPEAIPESLPAPARGLGYAATQGIEATNHLQKHPIYKSRRRCSSLLKDRVKYTESEVAHLKASFAGQKSPHSLRRRTFLPHLQMDVNFSAGLTTKRRNRGTRQKKKGDALLETKLNDLQLRGAADEKLPKISVEENRASVSDS